MGKVIKPAVFQKSPEAVMLDALKQGKQMLHRLKVIDFEALEHESKMIFTRVLHLVGRYFQHICRQQAAKKPLSESFLKKLNGVERLVDSLEEASKGKEINHKALSEYIDEKLIDYVATNTSANKQIKPGLVDTF